MLAVADDRPPDHSGIVRFGEGLFGYLGSVGGRSSAEASEMIADRVH